MSQITLKTPAPTEQTASSPLAWLSRAGFGVITLLAIATISRIALPCSRCWPSPCVAGRIRYF